MYGVENSLLGWLQSYLSGRSQCVLVEGKCSNWALVPSGVPQGSILGPLLFLLFINDMPLVTSNCTTALFADDAKCFLKVDSLHNCQILQNDLLKLQEWSTAWKMCFNPSKCKVLSITRSQTPVNFVYSLNGQSLEHVGVFKDLGIVIDQSLTFNEHITNLVTKCNKVSGMIKRSVGFNAPSHVKLRASLYGGVR